LFRIYGAVARGMFINFPFIINYIIIILAAFSCSRLMFFTTVYVQRNSYQTSYKLAASKFISKKMYVINCLCLSKMHCNLWMNIHQHTNICSHTEFRLFIFSSVWVISCLIKSVFFIHHGWRKGTESCHKIASLYVTQTLVLEQKAHGNEALNRSDIFRWYSRFQGGREVAVKNWIELR
jgi:hypothetical protein